MPISYPVKRLRHNIETSTARFELHVMDRLSALDTLADMQEAFERAYDALCNAPFKMSDHVSLRCSGGVVTVMNHDTSETYSE